MKGFLIGLGITIGAILLIALIAFSWVTGTYNNIVTLGRQVDTAWSQVETQYQRRFDLIPNLVNATRGYILHERGVFDDIAKARTQYAGAPKGSPEQLQAMGSMEGALARLLVIVENYPNLKADATVRSLMDEIAGTENRVNVARQRYNEQTLAYNVSISTFPSNILAGMFNFKERPLYKAEQGTEKAPVVNLEVK